LGGGGGRSIMNKKSALRQKLCGFFFPILNNCQEVSCLAFQMCRWVLC